MIAPANLKACPRRTAFVLLCIFICAPIISAQTAAQSPAGVLDQLSVALKLLCDRVSVAVVEVQASGYGMVGDNDPDAGFVVKQHTTGSGVILDSDGYIVTNAHVVKGAKRIRVFLRQEVKGGPPRAAAAIRTGTAYDATVVGTDEQIDVSVLKIQATGLPTLPFGSYEELRPGQMVIAIGSPFGAHSAVTFGIVSSVARQLESDDFAVYIQTDAALNPGNSGGALVDTSGKLVGINALVMDGQRQGFAIPSDIVKFSYEQIRRHGRVSQADIGFDVQEISPEIASGLKLSRDSGVVVADVHPSSSAERAGIRAEDIILTIDGRAIDTVFEFVNHLHRKRPGDHVAIQILRGSAVLRMTVALLEKKPQLDLSTRNIEPERSLIPALGVFVLDVDDNVADSMPGIRQRSGAVVTGKSPTEAGAETLVKFEIGDVIHALNGVSINSVADLRAATSKLKPGDAIVVRVERKRRLLYLAFQND